MTPEHKALVAELEKAAQWDDSPSQLLHEAVAAIESLSAQGELEAVAWPDPKVTNPDIAEPTGVPYLDSLIHQILDVQQDINLAANETMIQSLADASSFLDEVERCIRRFAHSRPAPVPDAVELRRYADKCREIANGGEYAWWSRLADILSALASNRPVGIPDPDVLAMSNGVISLHYEDLDAAQTAFDRIESMLAASGEASR